MRIEKLDLHKLDILTELFNYNDVEQMICECKQNIQKILLTSLLCMITLHWLVNFM